MVDINAPTFSLANQPKPLRIDTFSNNSSHNFRDISGSIYVEPGYTQNKVSPSSINTWRFIVDSQPLGPDEYLVQVKSVSTNSNSAYSRIDILEI